MGGRGRVYKPSGLSLRHAMLETATKQRGTSLSVSPKNSRKSAPPNPAPCQMATVWVSIVTSIGFLARRQLCL
ncbi:protein of unknown function (plasmid) [Cupriavidus taiwanensis]|uniref:Uncharacterized protein n=1 Tax=Cupriavidus taiwanensis TaxID=164546 RepID=A0A375IQY5_9BURK|nr:protein of unknown function [Cupriavidus taiwanensis]